jgi:hypothetical protein
LSKEFLVRPPHLLVLAAGLLAGCLNVDRPGQENAWRYHEVCPEGVKIFTSVQDVGQSYEQIGPLDSTDVAGWQDHPAQAAARRRAAGVLGANAILIGVQSKPTPGVTASVASQSGEHQGALAIFIRADSDRVRRVCATSRAQLAATSISTTYRRRRAASSRALGSATATPIRYRGGLTLTRAKAEVPDSSTVYKALAADPPAVDEATLARNPEMRWTMATARRVGIATGYSEGHPGILRVMVSDSFRSALALSYTLAELWQAYRNHRPLDEPLLIELWNREEKVGEYSEGGLTLSSQ